MYTPTVCRVSPPFCRRLVARPVPTPSEALGFSLVTPGKYQDFCLILLSPPTVFYPHILLPPGVAMICSESWNWSCTEEPFKPEHTVRFSGLDSSVLRVSKSTMRCSVTTGAASVCAEPVSKRACFLVKDILKG